MRRDREMNVDFRRRIITVQAAYAKNRESRSVSMNEVLTDTLWGIRMSTWPHGPVFCSSRGTPYRSFHGAFEHAVRNAGIPDFTFHDLRHTFARRLVMAGVELATVQELMGHKHITITRGILTCLAATSSEPSERWNGLVKMSQQFSQHPVLLRATIDHK
ncbi:Tyrosine recombinase XerC [Candidatus Entotheonellaceae bacterium PAL068K]